MTLFARSARLVSPRALAIIATVSLTYALTGCGMGGGSSINQAATSTGALAATVQGHVHGGNQPVVGASVQLYYAGTPATGSGYGVGGTALMAQPVTTDANGDFSITGLYTCPTPAAQVYIVATGGNPGLGGSVNNTKLAMMTALGTCPAGGNLLASIPFININEVTTVAAVTALQQFMAAPATTNTGAPSIGAPTTSYATGTSVGSVQSAVIGMNNAFITAAVLADPATGLSPNTHYAYATPESAKINTIADILAFCINSDPSSTSSCASLFSAATPSTATFTAADTIQAAWYMAQNPINNIANLYNFVSSAGSPFQPTYTAPGTLNTAQTAPATNAFNDTTIAINYAPTISSSSSTLAVGMAYGIAIDTYGNVWLSNDGGIGSVTASAVELGVDGSALITPATTFTASSTNGSTGQFAVQPTTNTRTFNSPKVVAVDLANRAWIANYGDSAVINTTNGTDTSSVGVFNGSTAPGVAGTNGGSGSTGYYVGDGPWGIAIDGNDNVFVVNTISPSSSVLDGASVAELVSSPGTSQDGTYAYSTSSSTSAPNRVTSGQTFLAIDTNPNVGGGILWTSEESACKSTVGTLGTTATYYGLFNLYSDSTLAPLSGSSAVSTSSGASTGAEGGTGNPCASSSDFIGQVLPSATANPQELAIDRNNGVWIGDQNTNSNTGFDGLTYIAAPTSATGIAATSHTLVNGVEPSSSIAAVPGTTLTRAGGMMVDGNNNLWVANTSKGSIVEADLVASTINLLTPGQGSAYGTAGAAYGIGFQHNSLSSYGLAIDPSGNVWVANNTSSSTTTYTNQAGGTSNVGNSITVIVGAAAPVVTPLALAIKSNKLGTRP